MSISRLGPLAIETKLGDHPSQSQVWRAIHVDLKKALAVKIFPIAFGVTPEATEALRTEWTTLQSLTHPSVARCYGGGFEPEAAYLAYELVDGETLSSQMERRGRLPWETVMDIADGILDALVYLHDRGIVHGRVEPSKILLAGLSPVLIDTRTDRLGSKFRSTRPPGELDAQMAAPELAQGLPPTPQSDLYSLAATLYWGLTGRMPEPTSTGPSNISGDSEPIGESFGLPAPSTLALDSPVWLDKFLLPMLHRDPTRRSASAEVAKLQLAEARKRSLARTSVVEATSRGFSPLDADNQGERAAVRKLLGREPVSFEDDVTADSTAWYERAWFLVAALSAVVLFATWMLWPLNDEQLRSRAEALMQQQNRTAWSEARSRYLRPLIRKYPGTANALWADEQIQRIEMAQAESALQTKLNKNLQLSSEAERLYAEALRFERFGDTVTALDKYRSLVTLLNEQPDDRAYVNLARRQIARIEDAAREATGNDEATRLVDAKLNEAETLAIEGRIVASRAILYSIIELYGKDEALLPQVRRAQSLLNSDRDAPTGVPSAVSDTSSSTPGPSRLEP